MLIKSLFPHLEIIIEYSSHSSEFNAKNFIEAKSLIPLETLSVLEKLYAGDLKSFVDMYIDAILCTEISALCKENGPRLKYIVAKTSDGVEVYSECFDPELLLSILLGDLVKAVAVYSGYRGHVKFKAVKIPKELLAKDFIGLVEDKILNNVNHFQEYPKGGPITQTLKNLIQEKSFSEVIFQVPCLDGKFIHILLEVARRIAESGKRVYIATSVPSKENARFCKTLYKDFVAYYLRLIEEAKKYGIVVCDSEVPHISIIVDRRVYMVSNEIIYKDDLYLIPITDVRYVNDYATLILKHCLCSNNLVKEDSRKLTAL